MSSAARAATKTGQESGPVGSLILGVILIFVGMGIETERFRATAIITGGILILAGIYSFIAQGEPQETPQARRKRRAQDDFIRNIQKTKRIQKNTELKEQEGVPCPSCDTINYPNTRFCLSCGKEM